MSRRTREALGAEAIEVIAHKGYFNNEEIAACEDAGISVYVPKPATSNAKAQGRFDKCDFVSDPANTMYVRQASI